MHATMAKSATSCTARPSGVCANGVPAIALPSRLAGAAARNKIIMFSATERNIWPGDARFLVSSQRLTFVFSFRVADSWGTAAAMVPASAAKTSSLATKSTHCTGAADEALNLLARYLRSFPKGKLVPDAEVMAIEAHAAKGDCARVVREVTRFLQRHPRAPQRTRVEQLRADAACE
jgi:hypothetical protein